MTPLLLLQCAAGARVLGWLDSVTEYSPPLFLWLLSPRPLFLWSLSSRLAMGDFDFHELYKTNRLLGPVLFLLYCVLTFFILVNVFIAIISDAFEEAKSMTQPSMIAKYFAMQLKKRLKHEKQSVAKIRMMVTEHLDDEIIDQAEILEIEAALSEEELEHWNVLKEHVDADDEESKGVLTKEEVMALCELMDEDVAALIEKQDMQEKQLHLDYSPERKETIKVQEQLASLEQKLLAMLGTDATITTPSPNAFNHVEFDARDRRGLN